MKIGLIFLLILAILPIVYAKENCILQNNQYICGTAKDPTFMENIKSFETKNPGLFWFICIIALSGLALILNYVFKNKSADRPIDVILKILLIIMIIGIIFLLVST